MTEHPYAAMLLWGIAAGLLGALTMLAMTPDHWPTMPSRISGLRATLAMLRSGGPLLLGRHGATGSLYPIGTDEEGIFVYLPLLSRLLGVANPLSTERYAYVVLFASTAAVYPLVYYRLANSLLAGLAAPLGLLLCARSIGFDDIYWIPAWGALTLLPLIYLLARDRSKLGIPALLGVALIAGWVSSMRANSGLAFVIAVAIVIPLRRLRWWQLLPALALVLVAYASTNTLIFNAIRENRNHRVGPLAASVLKRAEPSPHIWHTMYIGLGYLPNNLGIRYEDGVAAARVQRDAPGTPYLSARYDRVIREAYFSVLSHHPLYVIEEYAAKILATAAETAPYLLIVLLALPAMLLTGTERRARRLWALLSLPAIAVSFLPALIAIPIEPYEEGLYGVIGAMAITGVCWALGEVEKALRMRGRPPLTLAAVNSAVRSAVGAAGQSAIHRRTLGLTGVAVLCLTATVTGGYFINRSAERWQGSSSAVLIAGAPAGSTATGRV
jgi:hypothetical protein